MPGLRLCIDQVHDGFGLCQVESPIEKGAQGKLAGVSHTRSLCQYQAQYTLEDKRSTMSLDLHDILTCIGTGCTHESGQYLIDYFFRGWIDNQSISEQVRGRYIGASPRLAQQWMYKGKSFRSTDANYTYTTNARRCSNSCNRIVLHSRIIHQGVNESFLVVLLCFLRILHCPSRLDQLKHGCPDLSFSVAVCRFVWLS